ncbi:MAG: amidase, partial [Rhodospirillales bacterium]|nr:amidase [Rhodospirillales bacterium]
HVLGQPIRAIAKAVRDGNTSFEKVMTETVARHERGDDTFKAFKHWDGEGAMSGARAADAQLATGHDSGPLMGLPISAKDIFGVSGMPTFGGTNAQMSDEWAVDGPVMKALRQGGAVPVGKTHTIEFAFGAVGTSYHYGAPRNPWDAKEHRVSGGSSVGAGVSLGEGSSLLALGTDTGGSIRIPASVTGQVGLKVTIGRWSTDGIIPLSSSFDTPGFLTRTVEDAITGFAQVDPGETDVEELLSGMAGLEVSGLRLGVTEDHFWDNCAPGVAEGVQGAIDELAAKGATLVKIPMEEATEARKCLYDSFLFGVEGLSYVREFFNDRMDNIDPTIARRLQTGVDIKAVDYFTNLRILKRLNAVVCERLGNLDALVVPTVPHTPPTVAEVEDIDDYFVANGLMTQNTQPINMLALCGVSMPVALDAAGMPVGLQLVGASGTEERTLAAALAVEKSLGTGRERLGVPPLVKG